MSMSHVRCLLARIVCATKAQHSPGRPTIKPGSYKTTLAGSGSARVHAQHCRCVAWFICKMIPRVSKNTCQLHDRPTHLQHHTSRLPAKHRSVPRLPVQSRPSKGLGYPPAACPSAEPRRSDRRRPAPTPTLMSGSQPACTHTSSASTHISQALLCTPHNETSRWTGRLKAGDLHDGHTGPWKEPRQPPHSTSRAGIPCKSRLDSCGCGHDADKAHLAKVVADGGERPYKPVKAGKPASSRTI